jgi:2-oxoglutarate dehydrogenase E2 component (dihydrolipoamide succinyltransferase)
VATDVTLPQLGESVTEGTITAWLVDVGDTVQADQPLFELSSDKIDTEVPAPASGVLKEIKVQVDETVDVGTVVAVIGEEGEEPAGEEGGEPAAEPQEAQAAEERQTPDETPSDPDEVRAAADQGGDAPGSAGDLEEREDVARELLDEGADGAQQGGDRAQQRPEPSGVPEAATAGYERTEGDAPEPARSGNGSTEGVLASPIVRRMVAEHDLDITAITPSGEGGRVTREDVEAAIAGRGGGERQPAAQASQRPAEPEQRARPEPQAQSAQQERARTEREQPQKAPQPVRRVALEAGARERVEDLSRIRQRIAAKMMESLQSAAQLTTVQEADMTRIMRLREQVKDEFKAREGVSLSPFAFLCRAAVLTLRRPEFERANAQADWDAGKVKFHDYVNLGIAVDTERGLLVPNVKNADDLTLPALARAINDVATRARGKGQLEISDIEGGTFTVTNTGSRGVLIDTPILNYPEVAILGTGAVKKRPVVVAEDGVDAISIRHMIYLCLTYDHRLLDGADAARFVTEVAHVVETHDWAQEIGY